MYSVTVIPLVFPARLSTHLFVENAESERESEEREFGNHEMIAFQTPSLWLRLNIFPARSIFGDS